MSKPIFMKRGNTFRVSSNEAMDAHDILPVANYVVKFDETSGFYLEHIVELLNPRYWAFQHLTNDLKNLF